jgi:hypothetical protein
MGYKRLPAAPEGTGEVEHYMDMVFGDSYQTHFAPGTIAPGGTWSEYRGDASAGFDQPQPPMASISRVVVTDAAGYQWEKRWVKAGPARRVRRRRWWWWKRRGDL